MQLSSTALDVYRNCKRCFFLDRRLKVPRPRGIFPSLPGGMDRVMKNYTDSIRPPKGGLRMLAAQYPGLDLYQDQTMLNRWRNWKGGLKYTDPKGNILVGGIDDLLTYGSLYVPFDFKTKGSETDDESVLKYYQSQLDNYALILHSNQYAVADFGILASVYPETCGEWANECAPVNFRVQIFRIDLSWQRAKDQFDKACDLLAQNSVPKPEEGCEYCKFFIARRDMELSMVKK